MDKRELLILAEKIQFFSPSKAEALQFALEIAYRESREVNFEALENHSDSQEPVR
jgi:hypothetical protein